MSDPRHNPLNRQESKSSLEQTLRMLNPPQQAPITIYPGPSSSNANLSKADLEIAQRLESLRKRHNENIPTEEEMASRLAQIKGLPSDHYNRQQTAAYQRPDTRTNIERSDDLLAQVMSEVAIDASVPKSEDEIEARLARLRGDEHSRGGASAVGHLEGAVALPPPTAANSIPRSYAAPSQSRMDNSIGDDLDDMTLDEVEAVMAAASQEATNSAQHSLGQLEADRELAAAVAVAAASNRDKKKKHHRKHRKSGDKHDTDSDDSIDLNIEGGKSLDAVKEQEEVQRIIDMYTKRAQKKKERKKKQKEAAAAAAVAAGGAGGGAVGGAVGGVVDSDSDLEMSSLSDLSSESEKFSDSSDPISN